MKKKFLLTCGALLIAASLLGGCGKKKAAAEDEMLEEDEISDVVATLDGYGDDTGESENDAVTGENTAGTENGTAGGTNQSEAVLSGDAAADALPVIAAESVDDPYMEAVDRAAAKGLPAPPNIDVTSWEYVLASADHPLPDGFAPPEIAYVGSREVPQDSRIADALYSFTTDCEEAGNEVYLSSGYRSYDDQESLFEAKVEEYGREKAATIVLPPGTSEHQTGLCCDITDIYRSPKSPSVLSQTDTFQWLNAHCEEYGFILRYPEDKQEITNVIYEPWHFRYVGKEAAAYIKENNLCLEEFLALYGVE